MRPGNDSCGSKCCLPYKWRWNSTVICVRFNDGINGKSQRLWKRSLQPTQTFIEKKTGFWIGSKCKFWNRKDQLVQTSQVWNCSQLLNFIWHCSKWKLSHQQVWKLLSYGPKREVPVYNPELEPELTYGPEPFPVREGLDTLLSELPLPLRQWVIGDISFQELASSPPNACLGETDRDLFSALPVSVFEAEHKMHSVCSVLCAKDTKSSVTW